MPLGRVQLVAEDWPETQHKLAEVEQRMTAVLDELGLTTLAISIPGISAVGAAAVLAETGGPHRFATARALVKHAGLAPREKLSGTFTGQTRLTRKGRASKCRWLSPSVGESAETRGRRTCSAGECSRTVSMTQVR